MLQGFAGLPVSSGVESPAAGTHLAILGIADRVGLGVLDSDAGHDQVSHSGLGQLEQSSTVSSHVHPLPSQFLSHTQGKEGS